MEKYVPKLLSRNGCLLFRKYRHFFLPTLLAGIATSMSIIVDSILVGNMLGPAEMASVNLCMPVMQFFYMLSAWMGMGSSTLIAICLGKRDVETANRYFNLATWILLLLGIGIIGCGTFYSNTIAGWITDSPRLLPFVQSYLKILLLGCLPVLIVPASVYILRTDGLVKLASFILIFANALNLILDVVFMGPLQMGIAGSSLATIIGYLGGVGLLSVYFFKKDRSLDLSFSTKWLEQICHHMKEIFQTGLPAAMGLGLVAIKLFFMNHIVENIAGNNGLVIFSICLSCLSFISIFISGCAGTMMPIVGTLLGERDFRGIHLVVRYTLEFSFIISAAVICIFELFPANIFYMFGIESNSSILSLGENGLRIYALSLFGVSVSFLMMYYYLTIRKSLFANIISACEGLLLPVPLAWIGSKIMGLNGVWTALILTEVLSIAIIYGMVLYERKKQNRKDLSPLLIAPVAPEVRLDFSCNLGKESPEIIIEKMTNKGKALVPNFKYWEATNTILLDLFQQIRQTCKKKEMELDIRMMETEHHHQILIRDGGDAFAPTIHKYESDDVKINYSRVLSLNQIQITCVK